jgi:hypothetical protein
MKEILKIQWRYYDQYLKIDKQNLIQTASKIFSRSTVKKIILLAFLANSLYYYGRL